MSSLSQEKEQGENSKGYNSICPSKSTVYLGNIAYSLTNGDIFKLLEHCGKIVSTKVAKDKVTRKSKGYAFVQFLEPESALKCVQEYNGTEIFGRKWSCSIAKDNGRTTEFIRKRTYPDKSRCYECGDFGHLSYKCPKNALGDRELPKKRRKKKHKALGQDKSEKTDQDDDNSFTDESESDSDKADSETLSAAIQHQRALAEDQAYRETVSSGSYTLLQKDPENLRTKRKFVKDEYFSDEETLTEECE